jgi:hypothetical protein
VNSPNYIQSWLLPRTSRKTTFLIVGVVLALLFAGEALGATVKTRVAGSANWSAAATWIQLRTGTVSFTNGSTAVTGTGTLFTTELQVGDVLMLDASPATVRGTVASITSNTQLTLTSGSSGTGSGAYGRQRVPDSSDDVEVGNSSLGQISLTLDVSSATVNSLNLILHGLSDTLRHSGTNSLTVVNNVTVNQATSTNNTIAWSINAGSASVGGAMSVGGTGAQASRLAKIIVTTGSLVVSGSTTLITGGNSVHAEISVGTGSITFSSALNHNQGTLTFTGAGTMSFGGGYSFASGGSATPVLTTVSGATLSFGGDLTASALGGLALNAGSTAIFTGSATITPTTAITFGHVQVNSGATVEAGGNFTVAGNWTNNGGTFNPGSGTVTFNSTAAEQAINGTSTSQTFNNVTVAKSAQTLSVGGSTTTLTLNGTLILTSGLFSAGSATSIGIAGNWTNNGGTFTAGSGTVTFNSTSAAQAINGTATSQTFNNLVVNKSGQTLSIGGSTTSVVVNSDLTISAGTFDLGTATANRASSGGTLTVSNGATLKIGGTNTFPTNYATRTLGTTSTVEYGGTTQSVSVQSYGHLTVSGSGTKTLAGTITPAGDLTVSAGTLDLSTFTANRASSGGTLTVSNGATLKIGGTNTFPTNYATRTLGTTSTVEYGGTTQSVSVQSYGHLTVSGSGTKTLAGTITPAGDLTVSAGTLDLSTFTANRASSGGTLTVSNGATLKIGGTNTFPTNYATRTLGTTSTVEYSGTTQSVSVQSYGNLTISGSGTKTLAGSTSIVGDLSVNAGTLATASFALSVGGSWTNNAIFSGGTSTVTLTGAGKTVSGTTTFATLAITGSYTNGGTTTVGTSLTGEGSLTMGTGSTLNIGATTFDLKLFDATTNRPNTVAYTSTATGQDIRETEYSNLTIAKSAQTANLSADLLVDDDLTISSGILATSGFSVTVGGSWTNSGTFSGSASIVTLTGTGKTIGGSSTSTIHTLSVEGSYTNTATLAVTDALTGAGSLTMGPNATLNLSATIFDVNTFDAASNLNTVVYNSTTEPQTIRSTPYRNLTINKSSQVATLENETTANGDLTITSGILETNGLGLSVGGNWSNSGTFSGGSTTVTLTGTTRTISGSTTFSGLHITGSYTNNTTLTVTSAMTGSGSLTMGASSTLNLSATTLTLTTLTASASGNVVHYNSTTNPQTVIPATYFILRISKGSQTATLGGNTTTSDSLSILSGTLASNNFNLSVGGHWLNNGTFTPGEGRVTLTGAAKIINGITTFNKLTVTGTYTNNTTLTVNDSLPGSGTFTMGLNSTLIMLGPIINVSTFTTSAATHTIRYASTTIPQTVRASTTYRTLIIDKGSETAALGGATTATVALNILSGTLNTGSNALTVSGTFSNAGTLTGSSGTTSFTGTGASAFSNSGTISNGGTISFAPTSAATLTFNGNGFASTGTVTFAGGSQAVTLAGTGELSLNNTNINNTNSSGITQNSNWTVSGAFTVAANATFDPGSFLLMIVEPGSLVVSGTVRVRAATFGENYSLLQPPTLNSGSTVDYAGSVLQNVDPTVPYKNFRVSGSNVQSADSFTVAENMTVTGNFTASAGHVTVTGTSRTISGAGSIVFHGLTNAGSYTNTSTFSVAEFYNPGSLTNNTPGNITITGPDTLVPGIFTGGNNSILTFNPASDTMIIDFGSTVFTTTGTTNFAGSGTIVSAGSSHPTFNTIVIGEGTVLEQGEMTFALRGNITNNGTLTSTGIDSFANSTTLSGSGIYNFGSVKITGTLNGGSVRFGVAGDWSRTGTFTANNSIVEFNGTSPQTINHATTFRNLTIANSGDGISLGATCTVTDTLRLTSGRLSTGAFQVSVTRTIPVAVIIDSGYIEGTMVRSLPSSASDVYAFTDRHTFLTPVSNPSAITVAVTSHREIDAPNDATLDLIRRYYTITPSGVLTAHARLAYTNEELREGTTEDSLLLWKYTGSRWSEQGVSAFDTSENWVELEDISSWSDWSFGMPGAKISGMKFNDISGDGVFDETDPGIVDWRIGLFHNDVQIDSVLTDSLGHYRFSGLVSGTYVVREASRDGWTQTYPEGTEYEIEAVRPGNYPGNDFGNSEQGSISGIVFEDMEGDGGRDEDVDKDYPGWLVRLVQDGNPIDSVQTDGSGQYVFNNLFPGTYEVFQVPEVGWIQTYPANSLPQVVNITSGTHATDRHFGIFRLGVISGVKYVDINGNGTRNEGDSGLVNWRIRLSRNGVPVDSQLTNISGGYSFIDLIAGLYVVSEEQQDGWVQTSPPLGTHTVFLESGAVLDTQHFGNFRRGSISGSKFHDLNDNGTWDEEENGLSGWRIRLRRNGVAFDSVLTDAKGGYEFANLGPGLYLVSEALQSNWRQTYPPLLTHTIPLTSGESSIENDFGNFHQGLISGVVFHDRNGDSTRGEGEEGLTGWRIRLRHNDAQVDSALTDSLGGYTFIHVEPGTYDIVQVLQSGWIRTFPAPPGIHTVIVEEGSEITDQDFGNYQLGRISGVKFNDINGNGVRDSIDVGLQNWRIRLIHNSIRIDSALTDANGFYQFVDLYEGTYVVEEEMQSGWMQTHPKSPSTHTVEVTEGLFVTNRNFGNFHMGSIAGMKFNDMNGNGVQDLGDVGLSGWKIRLSLGGSAIDSVLTDGSGNYAFNHLGPGVYTVSEQLQPTWIRTYPSGAGTHVVTMTSGLNTANSHFGNFRLGTINGFVFDDLNGNGIIDDGEEPLVDWTVNMTGTLNQTETSDENGFYQFMNLGPGTYTVAEVLQEPYRRSYPLPPGTHVIQMTSGLVSENRNFGNSRFGIIGGKVFNDVVGDGVRDAGDAGLEGWIVELLQEDEMIATAQTDESGFYSFPAVDFGVFSVRQIGQDGWLRTYPEGETHTFEILEGSEFLEADFGNFQLGMISGTVFVDVHGEGGFNGPDSGLTGWNVRLRRDGVLVDSTITKATGVYDFVDLLPGSYTLSEEVQTGWTQTYPTNPGTHTLTMTSGLHASQKNFGNFKLVFISGTNFHDLNDNRIWDEGEPPLSGWTIRISGPRNDSAVTDILGTYGFSDLGPGTYTLSEALQPGWVQNYPVYPFTHIVTTQSGTDVTGTLFGNLEKTTFVEFHEDFESGTFGAFEPSDSGWMIQSDIAKDLNAVRKSYSDTLIQTSYLRTTTSVDIRGAASPTLIFWHIAKTEGFEQTANGAYDTCVVQISRDEQATWETLPASTYRGGWPMYGAFGQGFREGSYLRWGERTRQSVPQNGWWMPEVFDLSPYKASKIYIRFKLRTNGNFFSRAGWYIDNVSVVERPSALSGTFTVGGAADYPTVQDAVHDLTIRGVGSGGATFNVGSASYTDSVSIGVVRGTSAENPVRFVASGGPVTIKRFGTADTSTTQPDAVISLDGTKHITFDGISVGTADALGRIEYGYYVRHGAEDVTIKNANIQLTKKPTTIGVLVDNQTSVIAGGGFTAGLSTTRNRGVKLYNLDINNAYVGVAFQGLAAPNQEKGHEIGVVDGGTTRIRNIGGGTVSVYGIQLTGVDSVKIFGVNIDTVTITSASQTLAGVYFGLALSPAGNPVTNAQIYNNRIHNISKNATGSSVSGIHLNVDNSSARIYNNFIYDLRNPLSGSTVAVNGILQEKTGTYDYFYNTVFLDMSTMASGASHYGVRLANGTARLRNNNIVNLGVASGSGRTYAIGKETGATVSVSTTNNLFVDTLVVTRMTGRYNGVDKQKLADWKASQANLDSGSVSENPPFVNKIAPYDLHLNSSVYSILEYAGVPVADVTTDFDGDVRNLSHPDIGADEINGAPAVDNGVIQYLTPLTVKRGQTASVSVRVKNFGSSASPPITVRFVVDTSGVSYFRDSVVVSSLASGATTDVSFAPWFVDIFSTFRYAAIVSTPSDTKHNNDTMYVFPRFIGHNHAGGPDLGGYYFADSYDTSGVHPVYMWEDASDGTRLNFGAFPGPDDGKVEVNLPQPFLFYDSAATRIEVGVNGWMTIGTGYSGISDLGHPFSRRIPSTALPNRAIYPLWRDLDTQPAFGDTGKVFVKHLSDRTIVQWTDVSFAPRTNEAFHDSLLTFQVILNYTELSVKIQYHHERFASGIIQLPNSVADSVVVGIEGPGGSGKGTMYYMNTRPNEIGFRPERGLAVQFAKRNEALPIVLASFTGTVDSSTGYVRLDWMTVSEVNNLGFVVQRKLDDGQSSYADLPNSFVPGNGTTIEPQFYSWVDSSATAGSYLYRLKQMDLDGSTHFSWSLSVSVPAILSVEDLVPHVFELFQNYPNPFNPATTIKFSVDRPAPTRLRIYNILGQEVETLFNEVATPGRYYFATFNGLRYASGVYFMRLENGASTKVRKMLFLK